MSHFLASRSTRNSTFILFSVTAVALATLSACVPTVPDNGNMNGNGNANGDPPMQDVRYTRAFDTTDVGALSAVWGSGPNDVFVVGGTPDRGEVYHFDGTEWSGMNIPRVPILIWVFGFGPNDVYAVGEQGAFIRYDGERWTEVDSGTDEDLWGIWGNTPQDLFIVGGEADSGSPVILGYDGASIQIFPAPENDRDATALFKVFGIGDDIFAVGSDGLIVKYNRDNASFEQVPTGAAANDDFVSLWGTTTENLVAVGGRASGRLSVYDGNEWSTSLLSGVPGLNAVFTVQPDEVIIAGQNGYSAIFNPQTGDITQEISGTGMTLHGAWDDGEGKYYLVGGRFNEPYEGVAIVRTIGDPGFEPTLPMTPDVEAEIEVGLKVGDPYTLLRNGDNVPAFTFGQGSSHFFLTIRATGFPAGSQVEVTQVGLLPDDTPAVIESTQITTFVEIEPGLNEIEDRLVPIDGVFPSLVFGEEVTFTFTLTDPNNRDTTATTTLTLIPQVPSQ